MRWLNLHADMADDPAWTDAGPEARGIWLSCVLVAIQDEKGGVIPGAAGWSDRTWLKKAAITLEDVRKAEPLVRIVGQDVVVWNYPLEQERKCKQNRKDGEKGGRPKATVGVDRKEAPPFNPPVNPPVNPGGNRNGNGNGNGNGKISLSNNVVCRETGRSHSQVIAETDEWGNRRQRSKKEVRESARAEWDRAAEERKRREAGGRI